MIIYELCPVIATIFFLHYLGEGKSVEYTTWLPVVGLVISTVTQSAGVHICGF